MMNYNSFNESQAGLGPVNGRHSASQSSQIGINHSGATNGLTGSSGGVGYPTPVGHQADLTHVMSMIEKLSQVLQMNQNMTSGLIDRVGKIREKAKHLDQNNLGLLLSVASEINKDSDNLEKENSELRRALEELEIDKNENWKLAIHAANILTDLTEKLHRYKEQHEKDTLTWHKNYRKQLAAEREENLNIRCQLNDMKASACRANQSLRDMRRFIMDKNEWHELKIQNSALRQEKRYWKRLALPLISDDDSEWSDDDDLIDPEEKRRLHFYEIKKRVQEEKI